jgi:hypothetical protein
VAKPNAAEKGGSRVSPDWDFATRPCDKEKETSRLQHKETLAFALFFSSDQGATVHPGIRKSRIS